MSGVRLERLGREGGDVAALVWNASFGARHPLGRAAWDAWWASPDADAALTWLALLDDRPVGVLLARAPERAWAPPDLGHVSLLAVIPEARGRGVGGRLWTRAAEALRERGRTRVRLGADPERLLPGVPVPAPEATWRFLARRGVRPGGIEADLRLDLTGLAEGPTLRGRDGERGAAPAAEAPGRARLVDDVPDEVLAFVAGAFPGRWADEAARYAARGTALLGLAVEGRIRGFCVAHRADDPVAGPGLVWVGDERRVGGLGPLGVDAALRGAGLGSAFVADAARWLRDRGHDAAVVDWTTLTGFYGRLGAHAWRAYQRAETAEPLRSRWLEEGGARR